MIWHNSPKAKYVGQKSIEARTSMAVTTFNDGEMGLAAIQSALSIPSSYSTLLHLTRSARASNLNREMAILERCKRRRRLLASRTITPESSCRRREKTGKVPHTNQGCLSRRSTQRQLAMDQAQTDDWYACEVCISWYHSRCMRVTNKSLAEDPYICEECSWVFFTKSWAF